MNRKNNIFKIFLALVLVVVGGAVFIPKSQNTKAQTVCATAPTGTGTVTLSANVVTAGTYKVWSRLMVTGDSGNSYILQVDSNCAVVIGDLAGMNSNSWIWVDFTNGVGTNSYSLQLAAGTHNITLYGKEAGVKVDKLLLTTDSTCIPSGLGDNCTPDTVAPNVSITSPTSGSNVSGLVSVNISATDDRGVVSKVELYVNGSLRGTANTSPFLISWDTASLTAGSYTLTAKAYDPAGNSKTSTGVQVNKVDVTPSELTFKPTDDAYVLKSHEGTNYGGKADLRVDSSPLTRSFIKFNVSGIGTKQVVSAKLRLFNTNYSAHGGEVHLVTNNSWSEGSVNWNNAPSFDSSVISRFDKVISGSYYEVDVTPSVKSDGILSLVVVPETKDGAFYASKESSNPPQLVVSVK